MTPGLIIAWVIYVGAILLMHFIGTLCIADVDAMRTTCWSKEPLTMHLPGIIFTIFGLGWVTLIYKLTEEN